MIRAHLRRYGALDRTLDVQRVRLACGHRAPPRSWTLLFPLAAFLRQARCSNRSMRGGGMRSFLARPGIAALLVLLLFPALDGPAAAAPEGTLTWGVHVT